MAAAHALGFPAEARVDVLAIVAEHSGPFSGLIIQSSIEFQAN